ncbi:MAG: tetratricopeptide repeat protein [Nitrospinales bacterium]
MSSSHLKKRNWLILLGFSMMLALGIINLKNLPFSKKTDNSASYPKPEKKEDLADDFIRQASQNFYYREFPQAAENYYKAIAIYETRKDTFNIATTYEALGDLHVMAREITKAEESYVKAAGFFSQVQNFQGQTNVFKNIGDIHVKYENFDKAGEWYKKALTINEGRKPHLALGQTHEALGHLYWKSENISGAIKSFKEAQNTFKLIKYNLGYEHLHHVIQKLTKISRNQKQPSPKTPTSDKSPVY